MQLQYIRFLQHAKLVHQFSAIFYCTLSIRMSKIVNEYDQEIPQSQTADNPVAP